MSTLYLHNILPRYLKVIINLPEDYIAKVSFCIYSINNTSARV